MSNYPNPDPENATQHSHATQPLKAIPQKRVRRRNYGSPFLLPLWSIVLMLLGVIAVSGGVVLLVYIIGGATPAPTDPIFVIVTSPPTETPAITNTPPPVPTLANNGVDMPIPNFALEGPTLPPIFLSPTPDAISNGRIVQVVNVGEAGLNIRSAPGIENALLFTARENTLLEIIAGPETAREDSFTWWQIRDPFSGETGWAVDLYMNVQPETPTP